MSPDNDSSSSISAGDLLFQEPAPSGVRCTLCPHLCVIGENSEGICKARGVRNGRVVSLTYGRPASVVSDEIEKKPLFHFHPGTRALSLGCYGCNVLCTGCQNWQISHANVRNETARVSQLSPDDAVSLARRHKLSGVAFTYNDPVVWIEYVRDVCVAFKEAGLYTAFITAGFISEAALDFVGPFIEAFKFDLKAATPDGWARLTKVKDPAPALAAAVRAQEKHGCHVEVVSNIVPGLNDDDDSIKTMADWIRDGLGRKTPWHVTRFLPEFELSYLPATPIKTLEKAVILGKREGLDFVYLGNVPAHPGRDTICPNCGRKVIERDEQRAHNLLVRDGLRGACGEDLNMVDGWK